LRRQAAADAAGVALAEREARLHTQAHAKLAAERVAGDHDPAFDEHLAHRDVDLANHAPDFLEAGCGVLHEQYIGAFVKHRAAARGQKPLPAGSSCGRPSSLTGGAGGHAIKQILDVARLLVVELEHLRLQRLQIADLLAAFQCLFLLDRKLLARRDQNDVAVLAHVEALGLHDDIQRLVPGNVLEPQRQAAGHGITGDDIQPGEVGDDLQLLPFVALARALGEFVRIFLDRLDLEDEPVVRLVRRVLPKATRLDHHPGVAALREGVDRRHWGGEVGDVKPTLQIARHGRLQEVNDQRAPLLADVDAGGAVRQVDDDAALTVPAAAEIDVPQGVRNLARPGLGETRHHGRLGTGDRAALIGQRHQDGIALKVGLKGLRFVEVEHHARAVARLHDVDAAQGGIADVLRRAAQAIAGIGKIERDARRVGDRESRGRVRQGTLQRELDHGAPRAGLGHVQGIDAVGRLGAGGEGDHGRTQGDKSRPGAPAAWGSGGWQGAHRLRSCR
jgi:hypothetical protein